jgi:thioredoxin 1
MHKNMVKTLGISTLALFVLSITGAAAFSDSTNYKKTQEIFTDSKVSLTKNTVVEVTQLDQINKALEKGPVLLKIGSEWCESCQKMKPIISELATEYGGKATIMVADVDQSPKIADYFGVNYMPDSSVIVGIENGKYVYIQEDGTISNDRLRSRIFGIRDKEKFKKILDLAIQK